MAAAPAPYDPAFYRALDSTAVVSARRIVPILLDLYPVRSVIDVGCGDGGWLSVFREQGAAVQGVDGPWIDTALLKIPPEKFRRAALDQPLDIAGRYDLSMSLEVAEHLPEERAPGFVATLTRLAPVVLFSGAIPGQGGVHHVNEQWPAYWARLFAEHGYRAIDVLRLRIWGDETVAYWYKQNILIFASDAALRAHPALAAAGAVEEPLRLVHPELLDLARRQANPRFGRWLKMVPGVLRHTFGG